VVKVDIKMVGMQQTLARIGYWSKSSERAVQRAVARRAQMLRREIQRGIRSQAPGGQQFEPLKQSTIDAKGSSKALIDKGDLVRSVNVTKVGSGNQIVYFVGVHRSAVSKDGQFLANIAEIHEEGSKKVKDRPPARPFLRPSYNVWAQTAQSEFAKDVAKSLDLQGSHKEAVIAVGGF